MKRVALIAAIVFLVGKAFGESVPELINYQGHLEDDSGQPLDGVSVSITFRFYDAETLGNTLLTVQQDGIQVSKGIFSVLIGTGTIVSGAEGTLSEVFKKHSDVWMGVAVNADPEMTPRLRIGSVAYAMRALAVDEGGVFSSYSILGDSESSPSGYSFTGHSILTEGPGWWTGKEDMITPRTALTAVAVNGKIYAIGGYLGNNAYTAVNEEYDPATNTWTSKSSMPTARAYHTAVAVGDKIYVIGGQNFTQVFSVNEEYDPMTDTWATKASMPAPRSSPGGAEVDGKIYVISGSDAATSNFEYNPGTDSWDTKASIPTARLCPATAAVGGRIYVVGGHYTEYYSVNEEYIPGSDTWETKAALPVACSWFGGADMDGKMYVVGGFGPSCGMNSNTYRYDPSEDMWDTKTSIPTVRNSPGVVPLNGRIYAIGGSESEYFQTNEEYNPGQFYVHRRN